MHKIWTVEKSWGGLKAWHIMDLHPCGDHTPLCLAWVLRVSALVPCHLLSISVHFVSHHSGVEPCCEDEQCSSEVQLRLNGLQCVKLNQEAPFAIVIHCCFSYWMPCIYQLSYKICHNI